MVLFPLVIFCLIWFFLGLFGNPDTLLDVTISTGFYGILIVLPILVFISSTSSRKAKVIVSIVLALAILLLLFFWRITPVLDSNYFYHLYFLPIFGSLTFVLLVFGL